MDNDASGAGPSPDHLRVTVDGFVFTVAYDAAQPGTYHYTRIAGAPGGPAVGYGFTSRWSDSGRRTEAEHVQAIRAFIESVDPVTGYLEDEPQ